MLSCYLMLELALVYGDDERWHIIPGQKLRKVREGVQICYLCRQGVPPPTLKIILNFSLRRLLTQAARVYILPDNLIPLLLGNFQFEGAILLIHLNKDNWKMECILLVIIFSPFLGFKKACIERFWSNSTE